MGRVLALSAVAFLFSVLDVGANPLPIQDSWCTITYNSNGGSGSMARQRFFTAYEVTLNRNTFTRTGYLFAGWSRSPDTSPFDDYLFCDGEVCSMYGDFTLYAIWKPDGGAVKVSGTRYVNAGRELALTLTRTGGSGAIAVKYKSQTSTAICGQDFDYVKSIVTWADGDHTSRTIYVPTYLTRNTYQSTDKQLRIKLSSLTTGTYEGYNKPTIPETKIYVTMRDYSDAGTIQVKLSESLSCCSESYPNYYSPWYVKSGDLLRLTLSRTGGSDGYIAVKYKSQTSTAVCGQDFDYVKDILTWGPGDTSDRTLDIQTYCASCYDYPVGYLPYRPENPQLRVKLTTLTTGMYEGYLPPALSPAKIYVTIDE